MATRITITPEELRRVSKNFDQKAQEITAMLDYIKKEVDGLADTWVGSSKEAYFGKYYEIAKKMQEFPIVVDELSKKLSLAAQTLEQTDQDLASALKG